MAYEFATYEKQGHIAVVTINRPERMNSLHPPANFELDAIWSDFERDPEVWVGILTGAGDKAFSAGNDLRFTAEHGRDMIRMAESGFGGLANRTSNWKPIIAAVNGYALGTVDGDDGDAALLFVGGELVGHRGHRPLKVGLRFSTKAAADSRKSSVRCNPRPCV